MTNTDTETPERHGYNEGSNVEMEIQLGRQLIGILATHAGERGESEGAEKVLARIIDERNVSQRRLMEHHLWTGSIVGADGACHGCRPYGSAESAPVAVQQVVKQEGAEHATPTGLSYGPYMRGKLICLTSGEWWDECRCDSPREGIVRDS